MFVVLMLMCFSRLEQEALPLMLAKGLLHSGRRQLSLVRFRSSGLHASHDPSWRVDGADSAGAAMRCLLLFLTSGCAVQTDFSLAGVPCLRGDFSGDQTKICIYLLTFSL